jgi:hypothetical protein
MATKSPTGTAEENSSPTAEENSETLREAFYEDNIRGSTVSRSSQIQGIRDRRRQAWASRLCGFTMIPAIVLNA